MPPKVSAETMTFKTEQLSFLKESFLSTEASPLGKMLMEKILVTAKTSVDFTQNNHS